MRLFKRNRLYKRKKDKDNKDKNKNKLNNKKDNRLIIRIMRLINILHNRNKSNNHDINIKKYTFIMIYTPLILYNNHDNSHFEIIDYNHNHNQSSVNLFKKKS